MPPREAFLSHSSEDRATAQRIAELLREHEVPTFYALRILWDTSSGKMRS